MIWYKVFHNRPNYGIDSLKMFLTLDGVAYSSSHSSGYNSWGSTQDQEYIYKYIDR